MRKFFYFERRVVDRETRLEGLTDNSKYWAGYLSDYVAKKRTERGLEPPESRDYVRCPIDKEVEDILIQVATFTATDTVV